MIRTTLLRRIDGSGLETSTTLDIDLNDVALAGAKETLQTGVNVSPWLDLFDELLVSGTTDLVWKDSGPGKGRELKRAFSNILGRYFARAYLETHEGVSELVSIEGKNMPICNDRFRVRRVPGMKGDMPDWIGWTSSGFVIAEAKGSHDSGNWTLKKWPAPVEGALEQIARVEIVDTLRLLHARKLRLRLAGTRVPFKGWAVASRWATQSKGNQPVLIAIDPPGDGVPLNEEELVAAEFAMRWTYLSSLAEGLGIDPMEMVDSFDSPFSSVFTRLRVNDDEFENGISAVVTASGPTLLKSEADVSFAKSLIDRNLPFALVTLPIKPFSALMHGQQTSRGETRKIGDHTVRDNDLVVTKITADTDFGIIG